MSSSQSEHRRRRRRRTSNGGLSRRHVDDAHHCNDQEEDDDACDCNTIPPPELARILREAEKQREQQERTCPSTSSSSGSSPSEGQLRTQAVADIIPAEWMPAQRPPDEEVPVEDRGARANAAAAADSCEGHVVSQDNARVTTTSGINSEEQEQDEGTGKDAKELEEPHEYHLRMGQQQQQSLKEGKADDALLPPSVKQDLEDAILPDVVRRTSMVGAIAVDGISSDDNLSVQGSIQIGEDDDQDCTTNGDNDSISYAEDHYAFDQSTRSFRAATGDGPQHDDANDNRTTKRPQEPSHVDHHQNSDSNLVSATLIPDDEEEDGWRRSFPMAVPVFGRARPRRRRPGQQESNAGCCGTSKRRLVLPGWIIAVSLVVLIIVLFTFASRKASEKNGTGINTSLRGSNSSSSSNHTSNDDLAGCNISEDFCRLLFPSTRLLIQDGDSQSPQVQAYLWMLNDPHLHHYPTWRQLQRYALVTFYLATRGTHWSVSNHWLSYEVSECHWTTKLDIANLIDINADEAVHDMVQRFRDEGVHMGGLHWQDLLHHSSGGGHGHHHHHHRRRLQDELEHQHHHNHHNHHQEQQEQHPENEAAKSHQADDPEELERDDHDDHAGHHDHHGSHHQGHNHHKEDGHHSAMDGANHESTIVEREKGDLQAFNYQRDVHMQNYCDDDGVYRRLWPYHNRLDGTLPPELFLLSNLQVLGVCSNPGIAGSIPTQVGLLSDLQFIFADENGFTGGLPSELGNLRSLRLASIDSQPHLTGAIPTEIGNLQQLFYLSLSFYESLQEASIPSELGRLSDTLQVLQFASTRLTGALPSELASLSKLQILQVTGNAITGTVPVELGQLEQLQLWNMRFNALTGSIPSQLWQLSSLFYLGLCDNALEGSIPEQLFSGLSNLAELHLDCNQLTGSIPTEIGLWGRHSDGNSSSSSLEKLVLSLNPLLEGPIPSELGLLGNSLQTLDLSQTAITGTLPRELANLQRLEYLDIHDTHIHGNLSQSLVVGNLKGLALSETDITGIIPPEFCALSGFLDFTCSSTRLCGCHCVCFD